MWYLKGAWEAICLVPRWLRLVIVGMLLVIAFDAYTNKLTRERDNALFAKDSVEAVNSRTVLLLAGKNRVYSRRVVQTKLERDSLARALRTETRLNASLTLVLDSVSGSSVSVSKDGTYVFHRYEGPYTLDAKVTVTGDTGSLKFSIKQDPLGLGIRLECSESSTPVRSASILVLAPAGVTVSVDSASQSRDVCSGSSSPAHTGISRTRAYTEAGLFIGGFLLVKKFVLPLFQR
jgi:hypothetical protein